MEFTTEQEEMESPGRYAVWLVPDANAEQRFANVVEDLSDRYNCPRFAPHTTLLSGLTGAESELVEKTRALASELTSVDVTATGLAMQPYYFTSFYLKLDPSAALLLAYQKATQAFLSRSGNFAPHVSLLYGSIPRTEKISLGAEIHNRVPGTFTLDRLYLVHITLAVPNWKIISRFDLPSAD